MTDTNATVPADGPASAGVSAKADLPDQYGQALEELEELLEELEDAEIDVDHLAQRVARGVELVRFCRDRLAVVTADVDQVVADLYGNEVPANDVPADEDEPPDD